MTKQEITPEFVRELLTSIVLDEWEILEGVWPLSSGDGKFIAAAPRIAAAYLELAEDYLLSRKTNFELMLEVNEIRVLRDENKRLREALEAAKVAIIQIIAEAPHDLQNRLDTEHQMLNKIEEALFRQASDEGGCMKYEPAPIEEIFIEAKVVRKSGNEQLAMIFEEVAEERIALYEQVQDQINEIVRKVNRGETV